MRSFCYLSILLICNFANLLIINPANAAEKPTILVDIPPVYHLVHGIVGDRANIEILLSPEFSAHHFSLAPSQVKKIEDADYIIGIGSNFMPSLVEAAENVNAQQDHHFFYFDDILAAGEDEHADDPHIWLSPDVLLDMQRYYADALSDTSDLVSFDFLPSLASGHVQMPAAKAGLSEPRPIIASHQAFDRFEEAFDLKSYGALHDLQDQSLPPRQYAEKIFHIENKDIRCLLIEKSEHSHDVEDLAQEYDLDTAEFDILGWQWMESRFFFPEYFSALIDIYTDCGA